TEPGGEEEPSPFYAEDALLAVEVTSKRNARRDRKEKLWGYAHGPVPLYLLIDRVDPVGQRCTLYSEPSNGEYLRSVTSPFGEPVELPAPFDLSLDTARFR
ncbi:MAG: Uma2 family endonuclease, partial [Streptosporangiales bacterium]